MACLGTSGRQGLFVAVGTRCYRNQKFLCQLFLQNNGNSNKISNRQSVVGDGDGDGAFTDDGAITISKLLLNGNNTSASALSYGSTSTRYPVQKRHFHLLTNTTVPVAAACSANKDYSIMMVICRLSRITIPLTLIFKGICLIANSSQRYFIAWIVSFMVLISYIPI
uniref:Uncharacterized protein n=1 Tax=Glossina austeni TaxID=7395 RepID=A0A1A9VVE8_GLOAU